MRTFRIAVIAGDGVGKEVLPQGKRVLDRLGSFAYTDFPWGPTTFSNTAPSS